MATSEITLKLLIDTRSEKVLFAEAGKEFVDFLCTLFALPLGTVTSLQGTEGMVGCLGDLCESLQQLGKTYIQEGKNMDSVLKPTISISETPLLLPKTESYLETPKIYVCLYYRSSNHIHKYAANSPNANCPNCKEKMTSQMTYVPVAADDTNNPVGRGFVKGVVTYVVTDNLEVTPMSSISSIMLLNKFNIKDLSTLEERIVNCDKTEGLNLLKASLNTKSVLTSIFLQKKETRVSARKKRKEA